MRSLGLIIALSFCQSAIAAKVDSVSGKSVTIFLQSLDDEDVQVGDLVYLTDKSGNRKATLKVTNNRGVMADTSVVSGSPSKSHKVLMPHEAKKQAAPTKKAPPKKAVTKRRPRPKPVAKPTPKPVPVAKPTPRPRPVRQRPTRRQRPQAVAVQESEQDDPPPEEDDSLSLEPEEDEVDTYSPPARRAKTTAQTAFDWNISLDVLSLAGLLYDYQVFSFYAERRVSKRFSLGVSFNFGTFESNEGLDVTDKPLVRRSEFGALLRYNFSGDIYESGIFTALGLKLAQENWVATQNFSEATDGGFVGVLTIGYQWMLRALSVRVGYAAQYSSLPREAEFESVTHVRTEDLLTGISHYAVVQFGILF